ncbi:MAG: SCO family protein [Candidatus Bipolaricaulia bacterium]
MDPIKRSTEKSRIWDRYKHRFIAISGVGAAIAAVLAVILLLSLSRKPAAGPFNGTVLKPPQPAADFVLQDQRGEIFRLADAQGKVIVLTFLYTSCTDVCPFIGVKLKQAIELLGEDASNVVFVAVSMDPNRDTAERVSEYSREIGMYERWHYVIGTQEQLEPVWQAYYIGEPVITDESKFLSDEELRSYGLFQGLDGPSIATANRVRGKFGGGYDVGHATPVWLIDAKQRIRVKLAADLAPSDLVQDVRQLLKEISG